MNAVNQNQGRLVAESTVVAFRAAPADGERPGRPTFTIDAYSGNAMKPDYLFSPTPVVVDLAGLTAAEPIAVLLDHYSTQIVGQSTSVVVTTGASGKVVVSGVVTGDVDDPDDPAGKVVLHARNGFKWKASAGIDPQRYERVEAGAAVTVNGRTFTGPLYVLRAGVLAEVSLLSVGADKTAVAKIAAKAGKHKGSEPMQDYHEWLLAKNFDPTKLDDSSRDRLLQVFNAEINPGGFPGANAERGAKLNCAIDEARSTWRGDPAEFSAMCDVARAESQTPEMFKLQLLRANGMRRVPDNALRSSSGFGGGAPREVMAAALLMHCGAESTAAKAFPAGVLQAARDMRPRHVMDIVEASARMNPALHGVPSDRGELIRASFGPSTYSFPSALGLAGEKLMREAYADTPASWRTWTGKKSVNSFRDHKGVRPFFIGGAMDEVAPGGEIQHAAAGEETYTIAADTYGKLFTIDRRDLVNDDLGIFAELFAEIGRQAPRKVADLLYTALLTNAATFFGTGHANYIEGAGTVLSLASLGLAVTLLRKQKDGNGKPIALTPAVILVPPELEATAASIVNSTEMSRVSSGDQLPTGNPWAGRLTVEVEPRLSDTTFHASASAVHWYLFAPPSTPCAVVAFLNGREGPVTEQIDAPANVLGVSLRGYFDFGVALTDYRAGVRMKGSA